MNVEIRKLANGYAVIPPYDGYRDAFKWSDMYFFSTYAQMVDKLEEILQQPESNRKGDK